MTIDISVLKTEITTDPGGLGYVREDPIGNREKINRVRPSITFTRNLIPCDEVVASVALTEWDSLTDTNKQRVESLVIEKLVPWSLLSLAFNSMFVSGSATLTNIQALRSRKGTRAEQVFGENTTIPLHRVREVS